MRRSPTAATRNVAARDGRSRRRGCRGRSLSRSTCRAPSGLDGAIDARTNDARRVHRSQACHATTTEPVDKRMGAPQNAGMTAAGRTRRPGTSRDGGPRGALVAAAVCVFIGVLLRLWHVDHDLPDFNEEAMIFRKALAMWGPDGRHADLNPHFFVYPSLTIYIHFLVQHMSRALQGFANPADFLLSLTMDPSKTVVMSRWVS